ncbi:unnamed protein product, partial [Nesidiocoris tenuis]
MKSVRMIGRLSGSWNVESCLGRKIGCGLSRWCGVVQESRLDAASLKDQGSYS